MEDLGSSLSTIASTLMRVAFPLGKNTLVPLGMTASASAIDAGIQRKIHGSGITTLIISNEETNDIMKIVQALQDSNTLLKGITKTIENETKEREGGFLGILLGTLRASLLGNMLAGNGISRAGHGNQEGKGMLGAVCGNSKIFWFHSILSQTLKYESIIRMNLDLTEFILEIICLSK